MTDINEYIAYLNRNSDDIARNFGNAATVATYMQLFNEQIVTTNTQNIIERRGVGTSFVIGDTVFGKLGTQTPQPLIGDTRPAFTVILTTNPGSPFLDSGRLQLRDWLIGSSSASAPTHLLIGSGTLPWSGPQTSLDSQIGSYPIQTFVGESNQLGSFITIIPSCMLPSVGSSNTILSSGLAFNGAVTDYLSKLAPTEGFMDTDLLTAEAWIKGPTGIASEHGIIGWDINAANNNFGWRLGIFNGSVWAQVQQRCNLANTNAYMNIPNFSINSWFHIAMVYSGDSTGNGSIWAYGHGNESSPVNYTHNALTIVGSNNLIIGALQNQAVPKFDNWIGSIDEIRISKGIRRYNGNFTPSTNEFSTDANTIFLYHLNDFVGPGSIVIDSANEWNVIVSGNVISKEGCISFSSGFSAGIGSTISEIGISGGQLMIRDTFANQTLGTAGSEFRITSIFRIGS
jgi:hypothetical protein